MKSAKIVIPSHPKYLSLVRDVTARMGAISEMDEASVDSIKLAVDEACTNIIKHVYGGDLSRSIIVKYRTTKKDFRVIIEDDGPKSDIGLLKGRDLEDVRPGGLGIHFIRRTFDVVEFDPKKKQGNRLILIKFRKGKNENRDNGL